MHRFSRFQISRERFRTVRLDIVTGSEPGGRFYVMVAVSTAIASLGLITNSTAVVIGAMLVAPLMTPIFGIALALIRSDSVLLGKALKAEIAGVFAAVLMGFILGSVYPTLEATPAMLSRTQPQLFDLLVAVLAGFAGAYAIVDENISPALPGVAIATAIVPPLANCGLCFAIGAYEGGTGSFLLFFANFLSMLLVASAVFWAFGMTRRAEALDKKDVARRFGLPVVLFILVSAILSNTLFEIMQDRRLKKTIKEVLAGYVSDLPGTAVSSVIHEVDSGKVFVLADINAPQTISPLRVSRIEARLADVLKQPAELIIRSTITREVTAIDSTSQVSAQDLDGSFVSEDPNPKILMTKVADSIIRSYFATQIAFELRDVDLLQIADKPALIATVLGLTPLPEKDIQELESRIRERMKDPNIELIIRFIEMVLADQDGVIRYEWNSLEQSDPEQRELVDQAKVLFHQVFDKDGERFITGVNYAFLDGKCHFLLEIVGAKLVSVEDVKNLESWLAEKTGQPVKIHVWSKLDAVVTSKGYNSFRAATQDFFEKQKPEFQKEIDRILETWIR
jgi:uncharacterized hydrophobic protein (TIGR00271 family)